MGPGLKSCVSTLAAEWQASMTMAISPASTSLSQSVRSALEIRLAGTGPKACGAITASAGKRKKFPVGSAQPWPEKVRITTSSGVALARPEASIPARARTRPGRLDSPPGRECPAPARMSALSARLAWPASAVGGQAGHAVAPDPRQGRRHGPGVRPGEVQGVSRRPGIGVHPHGDHIGPLLPPRSRRRNKGRRRHRLALHPVRVERIRAEDHRRGRAAGVVRRLRHGIGRPGGRLPGLLLSVKSCE